MLYLIQKSFPYLWPYVRELLAGWIQHPYFKTRGYAGALKKFGVVLLLVAFLVLGNEYLATNRELEEIKLKADVKPPTYVSFEDVRNYHSLFNSPQTQDALNECRINSLELERSSLAVTQALEVEKLLHQRTKDDYDALKERLTDGSTIPKNTTKDNINRRLNKQK